MELKYRWERLNICSQVSFNRTAYGIEMLLKRSLL